MSIYQRRYQHTEGKKDDENQNTKKKEKKEGTSIPEDQKERPLMQGRTYNIANQREQAMRQKTPYFEGKTKQTNNTPRKTYNIANQREQEKQRQQQESKKQLPPEQKVKSYSIKPTNDVFSVEPSPRMDLNQQIRQQDQEMEAKLSQLGQQINEKIVYQRKRIEELETQVKRIQRRNEFITDSVEKVEFSSLHDQKITQLEAKAMDINRREEKIVRLEQYLLQLKQNGDNFYKTIDR